MRRLLLAIAVGATTLMVMIRESQGQEPVNAADSATQPSPGHVIFKEQFRFYRMEMDNGSRDRQGDIEDFVLFSTLNIGLQPDVALGLRLPVILRSRDFDGPHGTDRDEGIGDLTALVKWRVYRNDTGPLDSARLSLVGGAEIRTGDSPFTTDAYNPVLGLAYTQIVGRHGFNGSLQWTLTTDGNEEPIYAGESTADLLRADLAYLYRLSPKQYTAETHGALYAVLEFNGLYETNSDYEVFVAPGLMYEAKTWTVELSAQIPIAQEIEERAETEYAVITGVRFSW
jgi:hypothetical protein